MRQVCSVIVFLSSLLGISPWGGDVKYLNLRTPSIPNLSWSVQDTDVKALSVPLAAQVGVFSLSLFSRLENVSNGQKENVPVSVSVSQ